LRGLELKLTTITELTDQDCHAWDAYVRSAAHGLPQHLAGWRKVLAQTHGFATPYLMARAGERVVGVLPLLLVRSHLVGHTATTMPGGMCADSEQVGLALIARGQEIARQAQAMRFILHDTRQAWPGGLHTTTHHVHWLVDVRPGPEALWARLDGNIRRQVRIARANGLSVEIDRSGQCLRTCYELLSRSMHQLGTPLFGRDFLEHIVEIFPGGFNIAVVHSGLGPIGAFFQLQMGHTVYGMWGAILREYLDLRPTYLAYWEMLRDASANGYHCLDMGRSPAGSNASKFKGQWGGLGQPIYQQVASLGRAEDGASIAERIGSDRKFQLVRRLWPQLPLPVARYLGPKLRRHVPFA
jgi:FemAB-related protein (PEP-CTERM system-associated)